MFASVILKITAIAALIVGVLAGIVFGAPGGVYSVWRTLLYFALSFACFALLFGVAEIIDLLKHIRDRLK